MLPSCPLEIAALFPPTPFSLRPLWLFPSSAFSFQVIYHSSAGLSSPKHNFIMSTNFRPLSAIRTRPACLALHLPSLHTHVSCGSSSLAFLLWFPAYHPPPGPVLGEWRLSFPMSIPSTGLCPAHSVSSEAPLWLLASPPATAHPTLIAPSLSCQTHCYMCTWSHLPSDVICS